MVFSVWIGLLLGVLVLASALFLGHVSWQVLFNPEALLIVLGGTLASTLVSFSPTMVWQAFRNLQDVDMENQFSPHALIAEVMEAASFIRDEGILALQPILSGVTLPFLRKGLQYLLDNRPEKWLQESLSAEIEIRFRERLDYARIFETAGGLAPTMGIMGAVIGLMHIMQSLQGSMSHGFEHMGSGVASAFSATLYGVALSNLVLLPLASRLRQQAQQTRFIQTMLLEAILCIRSGEHPLLMTERLNMFVSTPQRDERMQVY